MPQIQGESHPRCPGVVGVLYELLEDAYSKGIVSGEVLKPLEEGFALASFGPQWMRVFKGHSDVSSYSVGVTTA
jgi:hypothetical protein